MHNTTSSATPALEAITFELLAQVSGGCHKHCCPCPQPAPDPQPMVQAPSAPALLPPAPSGPSVSTSVSINGQPAAQA